ncbi:MAG: glycosyltransferase [Pirellulaceae bacterium]
MRDCRFTLITTIGPNRGPDSIYQLLDSFHSQQGELTWQFIVASRPDPVLATRLQNDYSWVRYVTGRPGEGIPALRNRALKHAVGQYIVFIDDHIELPSDYLVGLERATQRGYDLFGGVVENANPETAASWAHYFCEYSKWLPVVPEGPVSDLPGSNFAIDRGLLTQYLPFPDHKFALESHLFSQCVRDGHKPQFVHDFSMRHFHVEQISEFWKHICFRYGIEFARSHGFGPLRRLLYAAAMPFTVLLLYARVLRNAARSRFYLAKLLRCTPLLLATFAVRCSGEAVGYLRGSP